jgi:hypothetical protein
MAFSRAVVRQSLEGTRRADTEEDRRLMPEWDEREIAHTFPHDAAYRLVRRNGWVVSLKDGGYLRGVPSALRYECTLHCSGIVDG